MVKILIGCPTFGLTPDPRRWLASLLTTLQTLRRNNIDFGFCFPYRKPIYPADNQIVSLGIMNGYTHILRMDDDIWGVQKTDILKLLDADKEFISGVMYTCGFPYARCAFNKVNKNETLQDIAKTSAGHLKEVIGDGVQPCDLTAFPYTLWKTSMFNKIKYPYFDQKDEGPADSVFCQKCLDLGIQPYVHLDVQLNHREVTPWNRTFLYNSESRRLLHTKQIDPTSELYALLSEQFGEDGMKDLLEIKGVGIRCAKS